MPRRREQTGFKEKNEDTGSLWSNLTDLQQQLFHPPLFVRLCHSIVPTAPPIPPPVNNSDPLNPIDITHLIADFNDAVTDELVDLPKITKHVARECLAQGRTNAKHEKKGRKEIDKVAAQVESQLQSFLLIDFVRPT